MQRALREGSGGTAEAQGLRSQSCGDTKRRVVKEKLFFLNWHDFFRDFLIGFWIGLSESAHSGMGTVECHDMPGHPNIA